MFSMHLQYKYFFASQGILRIHVLFAPIARLSGHWPILCRGSFAGPSPDISGCSAVFAGASLVTRREFRQIVRCDVGRRSLAGAEDAAASFFERENSDVAGQGHVWALLTA
jgi:hypothetical protein